MQNYKSNGSHTICSKKSNIYLIPHPYYGKVDKKLVYRDDSNELKKFLKIQGLP